MLWNIDVWREMERLRSEMNGLVSNYSRSALSSSYPLVNIYDDRDSVVVTAELPGAVKDDVSITFSDGALTIAGKQTRPERVKKMPPIRQERTEGKFEKSVRIPVKVNADGINASFADGVLTVTLPKAEEAKPKTITIQAR